jgi:hypothetical protein
MEIRMIINQVHQNFGRHSHIHQRHGSRDSWPGSRRILAEFDDELSTENFPIFKWKLRASHTANKAGWRRGSVLGP